MKPTKDKTTSVVVTTTKTTALKIKGVVIEMTVAELEDLWSKLGTALGKSISPNPTNWFEKAKREAEKARSYHPLQWPTYPTPPRPGLFST